VPSSPLRASLFQIVINVASELIYFRR